MPSFIVFVSFFFLFFTNRYLNDIIRSKPFSRSYTNRRPSAAILFFNSIY